jgi:DNA-binding PadR family transcriptional regulator
LKGALLCLLVQQRGYGYDLANQLERRLGPGWNVNRRSLYRMLESLERGKLASSDRSGGSSSERIMYDPTPAAEPVVAEWMGSIGSRLVLSELQAKLVVARREDLPRLLVAVDACERRCFAMQREITVDLPPRQSMVGALMYMAREEELLSSEVSLLWLDRVRGKILDLIGH